MWLACRRMHLQLSGFLGRSLSSAKPPPLHVISMGMGNGGPVLGLFGVSTIVALVVAEVWYLRAVIRLREAKHRGWSPHRTVCFVLGLATIFGALIWPIAPRTMDSFSIHVEQHIALMNVAPIFLALGCPFTLMMQTSSRRLKVAVLRLLRSKPLRVLHFPPMVWALFYGGMYAFFLSSLIAKAMSPNGMWLMDLCNVIFLGTGALLWWPVLARDPIPFWRMPPPLRMVTLFLGLPLNAFLGIALASSKLSVVPGLYSLNSTQVGGNVLWAAGEIFSIFPLCVVMVDWLRVEQRSQEAKDRSSSGRNRQPAVSSDGGPVADWYDVWRRHGVGVPILLEPHRAVGPQSGPDMAEPHGAGPTSLPTR
jgi:cytochrome c oxidase assembly factor CtaG